MLVVFITAPYMVMAYDYSLFLWDFLLSQQGFKQNDLLICLQMSSCYTRDICRGTSYYAMDVGWCVENTT